MKTYFYRLSVILLAMLTMNACEKGYTAEEETKTGNESNVTLRVKSIEMVPFENTRRRLSAGGDGAQLHWNRNHY